METPTQGASGYYLWEAEDKSFEVHVHLDVIDSLSAEIMRGFGAVPKRGAEVGGLLLGSIEREAATIVRIEDFEPVPCGYSRGPSFLLSPEERETFEEAAESWRPDASPPGAVDKSYAVGFNRSHTRDGLALAPEDIELMDACFAGPSHIALLVKPFATRASTAGFFFREDGAFQTESPLEFPFRRRELTGEEPPERRPLTDRGPLNDRRPRAGGGDGARDNSGRAMIRAAGDESAPVGDGTPFGNDQETAYREGGDGLGYAYAVTTPARSRLAAWMWIPLSFIFLLLGVALGYLAALNVSPRSAASGVPEYSLSLAVAKANGNLSVQWNGDSPAIRNADHGVLEVRDNGYAKTVDLDAGQLRGGRLAFHNSSDTVSFHLTVYINSRLSVSETLNWHP